MGRTGRHGVCDETSGEEELEGLLLREDALVQEMCVAPQGVVP